MGHLSDGRRFDSNERNLLFSFPPPGNINSAEFDAAIWLSDHYSNIKINVTIDKMGMVSTLSFLFTLKTSKNICKVKIN